MSKKKELITVEVYQDEDVFVPKCLGVWNEESIEKLGSIYKKVKIENPSIECFILKVV